MSSETTNSKQMVYDNGWTAFVQRAMDTSGKVCSCEDLGHEFGDELRRVASSKVGAAVLKSAYAEGFRSSMVVRDALTDRVRELEEELKAISERLARRPALGGLSGAAAVEKCCADNQRMADRLAVLERENADLLAKVEKLEAWQVASPIASAAVNPLYTPPTTTGEGVEQ